MSSNCESKKYVISLPGSPVGILRYCLSYVGNVIAFGVLLYCATEGQILLLKEWNNAVTTIANAMNAKM